MNKGIIFKNIFKEKLKLRLLIFFFERSGRRKALKLFEIILSFPVNCCGTEYDAKAIGPKKKLN